MCAWDIHLRELIKRVLGSYDTLVTQSEGKIEVPEGFLWKPRVIEIKEFKVFWSQ